MGDLNGQQKLEGRLLEVYPEAKILIETINRHAGIREVSVSDLPYNGLAAYGYQKQEEGPFWTLLRDDSSWHFFHVMSFGLNPDVLSISFRRRHYSSGVGQTYRGNESREFLRDNMEVLCQLYECWFDKDRKI